MGDCESGPETVQDRLAAFGPELESIYGALDRDVLWLHAKWLEYRKLYEAPERVALLNSSAPFFFHVAQGVMWHDVLLHIARLTDPAKQRQFENLSLLSLAPAVPDHALAREVRKLVASAVEEATFARRYRDKHLAHRDLEHALNPEAVSLSAGSREDVERVLAGFAAVLNRLNLAYGRPEVGFRDVSVLGGDAKSLLHRLALAEQVEAGRKKRASEGKSLPEDFDALSVP